MQVRACVCVCACACVCVLCFVGVDVFKVYSFDVPIVSIPCCVKKTNSMNSLIPVRISLSQSYFTLKMNK